MKLQRLLFITLFLIYNSITTQAQTYLWDRTVKSEGFDEAYDLTVDAQGNVYVTGMMEYLADFGDGVILESAGVHDIFIAKYDSSGHLIWAERAGGRDGDKAQSITLDGRGSLYIAGEFEDTSHWGPIMKIAEGGNNMFVAKYDTSGNVLWVQSLGTVNPSHTRGYGVCTDANGNVYAAGGTLGDTYFNGNFLFTSAGDYDGTLVSFDPAGNFRWAQRMGGTDSDKARGVVSDQGKNLYVTGYYSGTANFSGSSLPGQGHTDIFLAKYDTTGLLQWVTFAGDTGFDRSWDVDINVNGQILVAGDQSRGHFDAHIPSCQGMTDAFVAAYDTMGNNLWVTAGGGPEDDEGRGVSHDNAGNVYLIGDYGGSAIFPPYSFVSQNYAEPFIVSYTTNGASLRWIRNGTGPSNDRGTGIGLDPTGSIYACGNFDDSLTLGQLSVHGDSLLDVFVTRLSSQNICASTATVTGSITCHGDCNGSAGVSTTGQPPYSFSWNTTPVQFTPMATGLCAGTFLATVTDSFGCTSTASVTLTNPPPLQIATGSTPISCYGDCNGSAFATPAGQAPFTFSWNSLPVQNNDTATGLCPGIYTVTVTDSAGCTATSAVTFVNPPQLNVGISPTMANCFASCDGSANAIATGQAPFDFSWNTIPVQNTQSATALCAGNYTVTVTDSAGCTSTASTVITEPPAIYLTASVTNASCSGCTDGSIDLTTMGGIAPYLYLWSNGETTEDLGSLPAGTYSVCITDANLCTQCDTFTVTDPFTGIQSVEGLGFFISPNPFRTSVLISMKENLRGRTEVKLFNAIGELIYKTEFAAQTFELRGENLSPGFYLLELSNGNSTVKSKLIKE